MTPENDPELQLTALLLGELPPHEAARLHAAIENDAELAELYRNLKSTIKLVREATAEPESQPQPLRLSGDRREKLLAHFKTVTPTEFAKPAGRQRRWVLELSIAATVVGTIVIAMLELAKPALKGLGPSEEKLAFAAKTIDSKDAEGVLRQEPDHPGDRAKVTQLNGRLSDNAGYSVEELNRPARASSSIAKTEVALPTTNRPEETGSNVYSLKVVGFVNLAGNADRKLDIGVNGFLPKADSNLQTADKIVFPGPETTTGSTDAGLAPAAQPEPAARFFGLATNYAVVTPPVSSDDTNFRYYLDLNRVVQAAGVNRSGVGNLSGVSGGINAPIIDPTTGLPVAIATYSGTGSNGTDSTVSLQLTPPTSVFDTIKSDAISPASGPLPPGQLLGGAYQPTTNVFGASANGALGVPAEKPALADNNFYYRVPAQEETKKLDASDSLSRRYKTGSLVQDGKLLYEAGQLDEADAKFKEALKLDPGNPGAIQPEALVQEKRDANTQLDIGTNSRRALANVDTAWNVPPPPGTAGGAGGGGFGGGRTDARMRMRGRAPAPGVPPAAPALPPPSVTASVPALAAADRDKDVRFEPAAIPPAISAPQPIPVRGNAPVALALDSAKTPPTEGALSAAASTAAPSGGVVRGTFPPTAGETTTPELAKDAQSPANKPKPAREPESLAKAKTPVSSFAGRSLVSAEKQLVNRQDKLAADQQDLPLVVTRFASVEAQPEILTTVNSFSTFSLNVSDVSFALAAATLEKGEMPDPASIRSEEFINAFDYRDPEPAPGAPIGFAWERVRSPFTQNRDLVRFSVKTAAAGRIPGRPLNLVLLLDNSGSMERADRVRIIHEALHVLAAQLQPWDTLSVVLFARTARLWVDGVSGSQANAIVEQVSSLTPDGGTNLEDALNLAYATALRHYLPNGANRVVLLTDGAANLGNVNPDALKKKAEANRKQGIALDAFGIGWEGYNDDLLEVLTRTGGGRYRFINSPEEAATGFASQLAGALHVAAEDVKVQVEFNPSRVTAYRQVGYARHQLTKEQFRDNNVKAAQIGAAESGNALYVVAINPVGTGPLGTVHVRYKVPGTQDYQEHEWTLPYAGPGVSLDQAGPAMRLAATAAEFSEWLANSADAGGVTTDQLLGYLRGVPEIYGADARPKKLEWMLRQAKSITGR